MKNKIATFSLGFLRDKNKLNKITGVVLLAIIIFFIFLYSFMSLNNYRLFEVYGWDQAVFNQGMWQWSNFRFPYSSFHDLPWLADHFHLILIVLAPFYKLFPGNGLLLVSQVILICLGALPIYLLSKKIVNNPFVSLSLVVAYLTFYSLQWAMFSGFHELAFLPLTLGFSFYFWETKRTTLYWVFLVLALMVNEQIGFLISAFGIWSIVTDKKRWKQGLVTTVVSLTYSLFLINFLMPAIGGEVYRHSGFGMSGGSVNDVLVNIIRNPLLVFKAFIDSPIKIKTIFITYWPWGLLPLIAPTTQILAFEQFASRFLDYEKTIRWTPYFTYSLPMAIIMAWSSIYGVKNLSNWILKRFRLGRFLVHSTIALLMLLIVVFEDFYLHAPINSIFKNSFYRKENWMSDNIKVISCLPDNVSVSAQNNLAPYVSERNEIKVFPEGLSRGYDYILVDFHRGQSDNSFHFLGKDKSEFIISDLQDKNLYESVCRSGDAILLKRIADISGELEYPFKIDIFEK